MASVSSPVQVTPTSSLWAQLCFPQEAAGHSDSEASVPTQPTSSSQMGPAPQPKRPAAGSGCRGPPQPSSRQTTAESLMSQLSSQTVPQRPSCHTSSRPEHLLGPATRRNWGDPGIEENKQTNLESGSKSPYSILNPHLPAFHHLSQMPIYSLSMLFLIHPSIWTAGIDQGFFFVGHTAKHSWPVSQKAEYRITI